MIHVPALPMIILPATATVRPAVLAAVQAVVKHVRVVIRQAVLLVRADLAVPIIQGLTLMLLATAQEHQRQ